MRHKATKEQSEMLIKEDNQVKAELMAGSDGAYPQVNLHDARHITDKKNPNYGKELLDPVPMQPPVGRLRATSLLDTVRDQIRIAKLNALNDIQETVDEADDFEIDDEPADPASRWENDFEPSLKDLKRNREMLEARIAYEEAREARQTSTSTQAPQGQSAASAPGAGPPQRSGAGEDSAPGERPLPSAETKKNFFGR